MTRMNQNIDSMIQVQNDNQVVGMDMVRVHGIGTATSPYLRGKRLGSLSKRCPGHHRSEQRSRWLEPATAAPAGLSPAAAERRQPGQWASLISARFSN